MRCWSESQAWGSPSACGGVAVLRGLMYALSYYLVRRFCFFQAWLLIATPGVVAVAVVAALSGVDVARCLVILTLAPTVTVMGSELRLQRWEWGELTGIEAVTS
jgi:hypothetical protein